MFRALAEIDNDGRVIRRALPFSHLLAETGVDRNALHEIVDRFRADDCCFLVPPLSTVANVADDTLVDVGHEALLRRWDRIGSRAAALADGGGAGWLVTEEQDGRRYRALLALVEGRRGDTDIALPLGQTEEWLEWWNARPRTGAWAERYGGRFDRIRKLLDDSLAALKESRARLARQRRRDQALRAAAGVAVVLIVGLLVVTTIQMRRARELQSISDQQTQMIFGQLTSLMNVTFENFRVVPHSYVAGSGLVSAGKSFETQYKKWAAQYTRNDNAVASFDITLDILSADLQLISGYVSDAIHNLDRIEPLLTSIPDTDASKLLVMAEFHFHRGTAERYDDLFAQSRYDYYQAIDIANRIIADDNPGRSDDAVVLQAGKLLASSKRILVELDYAAHIITGTATDLGHAIADERAYDDYMVQIMKASSAKDTGNCSDLSNLAGDAAEKLNHAAEVELEQGRHAEATPKYLEYVRIYKDKLNGPCEKDSLLDHILLASGELGLARALIQEGKLDDAGQQLDDADRYYETELKPGDPHNAFALHLDDQVHWVRGWLALDKNDPAKARVEFDTALKATGELVQRDPADAREWDDTYLALKGRTAVDLLTGDKVQAAKDEQAAGDALEKANKARQDALTRLPTAEREAIIRMSA